MRLPDLPAPAEQESGYPGMIAPVAAHSVGQNLISLDIRMLLFIIRHQHYLIRHYSMRPRIWRHLVELRSQLAWLLQHWPSSNVLSKSPRSDISQQVPTN